MGDFEGAMPAVVQAWAAKGPTQRVGLNIISHKSSDLIAELFYIDILRGS